MKKSLLKISVAAVLLMGMVTACKKGGDDNKNTAITRENLAGTYKLNSLTVSATGVPEQDYLEPCQKDDQYELKLDSTANFIDAGTKCDPPGDDTGEWHLDGNTITVTAGTELSGTIQSFNGHTLVITSTQSILGYTATLKATLTKL